MFNKITSDFIKSIPPVEGVDVEHLPQILSQIYAQIIGLKTKYEDDEIPFEEKVLQDDLSYLGYLSMALEVYLESGQFDAQRNSIAYVAAMCHKLAGKLISEHDTNMSFYEIPSEVVAILLFIIGHYFSDAEEMAKAVNWRDVENKTHQDLIWAICCLAQGRLTSILRFKSEERKYNGYEDLAESLLWDNLFAGIRELAKDLLGEESTNGNGYFSSVLELTQYRKAFLQEELYYLHTGPNRLARLLMMASGELIQYSLANINSPVVEPEIWKEAIRRIAVTRPYLWDNHKNAFERGFLNKGISSVITFPTGAGKSTLVELKILQTVLSGAKVVYIVPTHALEHQVKRNISRLLNVEQSEGVKFDGEFTTLEEEEAPVYVMTPERCSTLMTLNPSRFNEVELIVMDEFHIISSKDKGNDDRSLGAMLCLLSFFQQKPQADYVLISAMVENGGEIADWIYSITGQTCLDLSMNWKPTSQLQGCLVYQQDELNVLEKILDESKQLGRTKNPSKKDKEKMLATPYCLFGLSSQWDASREENFYLLPILHQKVPLSADSWRIGSNKNVVSMNLAAKFASLGMKSIVFVDKPTAAQSIAKKLVGKPLRTAKPSAADLRLIKSIGIELGGTEYSFVQPDMNVAIHHANLLPEERRVMESFFMSSVDVMAATPTLAQGVNLPADVVIIAGELRYDQERKVQVMISADEILNAAGRAGRAGHRAQGASILVPSHVIGYDERPTSTDWYDITNNIFAKGDQCLSVDDPINKLLFDIVHENTISSIQQNALLKINNFREQTRDVLRKSLFAYRLRKSQREKSIELRINRIMYIAALLDKENIEEPWIRDVSFKTGVDVDIIRDFYQWLEHSIIDDVIALSVELTIHYYCAWLLEKPYLLEQLLLTERSKRAVRKLLEGNEEKHLTQDGIKRLELLLEMYVSGATLAEINKEVEGEVEQTLLDGARLFVLKVLPLVSFAFSTLSMSVISYAASKGYDEKDISDEVTNFAIYLKEGVLNGAMLYHKTQHHKMRVETHLDFRN